MAVVTDSTAALRPGLSVRVVPLRVHLGDRTSSDGRDVTPAQVVAALRARVPVSTSRPAPGAFAAVYEEAFASGFSAVVSVHLSAALSGTWHAAASAARNFPHGTVRVVDSRVTAGALGLAVSAAARRAADGAPAAEVEQAALDVVDRSRTLFYVDTVEHLRRGGRIGGAASLLATSLSIRPLLQLIDGRIVGLEKVRTPTRALARLVTRTVESAGPAPVEVVVHHLDAAPRAEQVADLLTARLPGLDTVAVDELGPVLAAHLGPGAVGVVVLRSRDA